MFILTEILAEFRAKWVPHPFCLNFSPSMLNAMLSFNGPNFGRNFGVGTMLNSLTIVIKLELCEKVFDQKLSKRQFDLLVFFKINDSLN